MEQELLDKILSQEYSSNNPVSEQDLNTIRNILTQKTSDTGSVKTYTIQESQAVILANAKLNALLVVLQILARGAKIPNDVLDLICDILFLDTISSNTFNLNVVIELQRLEREIYNSIIEIIYFTEHVSQRTITELSSKNIADELSINLAPLVNCEYRSYELGILSRLELCDVLTGFIDSYKTRFHPIVKKYIIDKLILQIPTGNKKIIYSIFFLINENSYDELLQDEEYECEEYIGFVCSLIYDSSSANLGFEKLKKSFDTLEGVLNKLVNNFRVQKKLIRPKDEKTIHYILEAMNKLVRYKRRYFYRFIGLLQNILQFNSGKYIKGTIYDILSQYLHDSEVFVERIVECKTEIDSEISKNDFFLLPKLIRFLNAYQNRVETEKRIFKMGMSSGSPYLSFSDSNEVDFKILGLCSEDPKTVIECFETDISMDTIKLNAKHLRAAMIKSEDVIKSIVSYQLKRNVIIDDISIISMIICTRNPLFFDYAKLFDNYSYFLNESVLERIVDDLPSGLRWLMDGFNPHENSMNDQSINSHENSMNDQNFNQLKNSLNDQNFHQPKRSSKDVGIFIIRNCNFFNEIIKTYPWSQRKLLEIYDCVLEDHIGNFEIKVMPPMPLPSVVDVLFVSDASEMGSPVFFKIFSKQLVFAKFFRDSKIDDFILKNQSASNAYGDYVRSKAMVGLEVIEDIKFLKKNLIDCDEIVGFLKITRDDSTKWEKSNSDNMYANFGKNDLSHFIKRFPVASELEKFILFFGFTKKSDSVESMIKEEIMQNLKNPNKIYLEMLVFQLFRCKDLDNVLRVLERNYEDKKLILKLSIHNIATGGRYFSSTLLEAADRVDRYKALFLLYYMNIWDKELVLQHIDQKAIDESADIRYLVDDLKNSNA